MKIRSLNQLIAALDSEYSWRIKEISAFKRLLLGPDIDKRHCITRAAIPIIYCHWEGFIKASAGHYSTFVSSQVSQMSELQSCFMGPMLKSKLESISASKRAFRLWHEGAQLVFDLSKSSPKIDLSSRISNIGNLNFEAFSEIVYVCGFQIAPYETKRVFIDEVIVGKRNRVAHGEHMVADLNEVKEALEITLGLMRQFKNDIENGAAQKTYLS